MRKILNAVDKGGLRSRELIVKVRRLPDLVKGELEIPVDFGMMEFLAWGA